MYLFVSTWNSNDVMYLDIGKETQKRCPDKKVIEVRHEAETRIALQMILTVILIWLRYIVYQTGERNW